MKRFLLILSFVFANVLNGQNDPYDFWTPIHKTNFTISPVLGYAYPVNAFKQAKSTYNFGMKFLYRHNKNIGISNTYEIFGPINQNFDFSLDVDGSVFKHDSGFSIINSKIDFEFSLYEFSILRPTLCFGLGYGILETGSFDKRILSYNIGLINYFNIKKRMLGLSLNMTQFPYNYSEGTDINGSFFSIKMTFYFSTLYFVKEIN